MMDTRNVMVRIAAAASTVLLLSAVPQGGTPAKYAVVINSSNSCQVKDAKARGLIKQLFLKQLSRWPDGLVAKPYARKKSSKGHSVFGSQVLQMSGAEQARHWLRAKHLDGTTAPNSVSSDRMLLKHIEKHDGALGVVSLSALQKANKVSVRILYRF
ncbi:MAG: hypothetical protein AB8H80_10510 [Planctomycetota bacterium]